MKIEYNDTEAVFDQNKGMIDAKRYSESVCNLMADLIKWSARKIEANKGMIESLKGFDKLFKNGGDRDE